MYTAWPSSNVGLLEEKEMQIYAAPHTSVQNEQSHIIRSENWEFNGANFVPLVFQLGEWRILIDEQ